MAIVVAVDGCFAATARSSSDKAVFSFQGASHAHFETRVRHMPMWESHEPNSLIKHAKCCRCATNGYMSFFRNACSAAPASLLFSCSSRPPPKAP
jgi:hypothetical protein